MMRSPLLIRKVTRVCADAIPAVPATNNVAISTRRNICHLSFQADLIAHSLMLRSKSHATTGRAWTGWVQQTERASRQAVSVIEAWKRVLRVQPLAGRHTTSRPE